VAFSPKFSFSSSLLVSRVLNLCNVTQMTLQPAESIDSNSAKSYVDSESQVWTKLSIARILHHAYFYK